MRILELCYEYPPIGGGGGQVVAALSKELVKLGHQVDLVTMGFRGLPNFEQDHGVNIHRVPSIRLKKSICHPPEMAFYLVSALPRLLKMVKQNHYDINHTHFIFPDGILALILKNVVGLPYIITAHGSDVPGYNPNRFKSLHRILNPLWRRVVQDAKGIVSPSQNLARLIAHRLPEVSITLIPNGVQAAIRELSIKDDLHILVVSRMFERKGIQYFLKSLEGIQDPYQVDIVGDGPYLPTLKTMARNLNSKAPIVFHGWLDHHSTKLQELMAGASLFVMPSESENFPIVLLEAMAAGLAIITTEGTGCEEVVGNAALLVKPKDPIAILDAILTLINKPELRSQLSKTAIQRVNQEYKWDIIARRYVELYNQAIVP